MTAAFITALVDTLLPGEVATSGHARPLPSGSSLRLDVAECVGAFRPLLQAIVEHSGGAETFAAASADERLAILDAVDAQTGGRLRELAMSLLQNYYESLEVLEAMCTPTEPPQPRGRDIQPNDAATLASLDRVRARGRIWR